MAPAHHAIQLEKTYRIGEVAAMMAVEPYVLRYWETEFPRLRPAKSIHGQRLYRDSDIETIRTIKRLLYQEGFTIAGARKQLEEKDRDTGPPAPPPMLAPELLPVPAAAPSRSDHRARETLHAIRTELDALLTKLSRR